MKHCVEARLQVQALFDDGNKDVDGDGAPSVKPRKDGGRRNTMKSSTKDQAEGTFHKVKGKLREVAGKLSENPELEAKGKVEKIAGKVQEKVGQIKKVVGK